jgi:hypothetical protein
MHFLIVDCDTVFSKVEQVIKHLRFLVANTEQVFSVLLGSLYLSGKELVQ